MLVSIIAMPRPKSGERSGALRKRYVSSGVEYEPYVYQLFTRMPRGLAGRPQNGAQDSAEQIAAARNERSNTYRVDAKRGGNQEQRNGNEEDRGHRSHSHAAQHELGICAGQSEPGSDLK